MKIAKIGLALLACMVLINGCIAIPPLINVQHRESATDLNRRLEGIEKRLENIEKQNESK